MDDVFQGVNVVAVCPSRELRDLVIKVIEETTGIRPVLKSTSASANRAHYAPATSKLIINTAAARMHAILGIHSVALALEVADRVDAARRAQQIFQAAGYQATVHTHAEPEFPDGFMVFVAVPDLQGIVILFWPRPEDVTPEMVVNLPKRVPW